MPLPSEVDRNFLLEVLYARETIESTGICGGIAIPHVRNPIVLYIPHALINLTFLEKPVEFGAIDNIPVHTLFTIVSPSLRSHLSLLSRLAYALHNTDFRRAVENRLAPSEILRQAGLIDSQVARKSDNS
jgi:PTS system nitrogen regulatory IIA component